MKVMGIWTPKMKTKNFIFKLGIADGKSLLRKQEGDYYQLNYEELIKLAISLKLASLMLKKIKI